ncbi:MAG TPA: hypothetical protein VNN80_15995, partial [Polyangiaceae bacterium]|nr:hypothetical protein [Polyangiaceae bacterium]
LAGQALSLGIVRDGDDLPEAPGPWLSLEELARIGGAAAPLAPVATTASVALIRPRSEAITPSGGGASAADGARERLTHADIVADARRLLAAGGIGAGKEALAARDVPNAAQLGSVLGAWLVAGLTLSFVETAETEDQDRRELGPHVVFGRAGGYTDLAARTNEALPQGRGLWTRWLSSALDGSGAASLARRLLVSRLREVVGFGRLERAIVLDDAAAARAGLQRLFGVAPFEWPSRAGSRLAPAPPALEALPESSLLGGLGAASRSDLA